MKKAPKPLPALMQEAIEVAKEQGGKLFRHDNTFWGPKDFDYESTSFSKVFGTQTVKGLVARKRMRWTEWGQGPSGKFPTEAELVEVQP